MAFGTITQLTDLPQGTNLPANLGALKYTVTTIVGDGAYATGGTALSASQLGLNTLVAVLSTQVAGGASNNGAVTATYNYSTGKLQMWAGAGTTPNIGLAEAANAGNLSGLTITVVAVGY
jgi:hypothetical protein